MGVRRAGRSKSDPSQQRPDGQAQVRPQRRPKPNRALHDITLTRWRACPRTHAYIAKKRSQGKNDSEIRRSIKRYIARELFRAQGHPRPLDKHRSVLRVNL